VANASAEWLVGMEIVVQMRYMGDLLCVLRAFFALIAVKYLTSTGLPVFLINNL
jgi:hypothetical protein